MSSVLQARRNAGDICGSAFVATVARCSPSRWVRSFRVFAGNPKGSNQAHFHEHLVVGHQRCSGPRTHAAMCGAVWAQFHPNLVVGGVRSTTMPTLETGIDMSACCYGLVALVKIDYELSSLYMAAKGHFGPPIRPLYLKIY